MSNILGKFAELFKEKKGYYLIILLMFCTGVVLGAYTIKYMGEGDKTDLANYFTNYVNGVGDRPVEYGVLFFDIIKKNLMLIIPIMLFGFAFFGAPFILLINLIKGFTIGYTFTFLLSTYGGKGVGVALASTIPQNIFYIPCFIALSVVFLDVSITKFREKLSGKNLFNFQGFITYFGNNLVVILCILVVGIIVETYLCPGILKFVVTKFYV
ncbi:MAG: stage II sporulation protein M [Clostridium sp.]